MHFPSCTSVTARMPSRCRLRCTGSARWRRRLPAPRSPSIQTPAVKICSSTQGTRPLHPRRRPARRRFARAPPAVVSPGGRSSNRAAAGGHGGELFACLMTACGARARRCTRRSAPSSPAVLRHGHARVRRAPPLPGQRGQGDGGHVLELRWSPHRTGWRAAPAVGVVVSGADVVVADAPAGLSASASSTAVKQPMACAAMREHAPELAAAEYAQRGAGGQQVDGVRAHAAGGSVSERAASVCCARTVQAAGAGPGPHWPAAPRRTVPRWRRAPGRWRTWPLECPWAFARCCSESTPRRWRLARTPSTGTVVLAAIMPGRWAAPPAPAMMAGARALPRARRRQTCRRACGGPRRPGPRGRYRIAGESLLRAHGVPVAAGAHDHADLYGFHVLCGAARGRCALREPRFYFAPPRRHALQRIPSMIDVTSRILKPKSSPLPCRCPCWWTSGRPGAARARRLGGAGKAGGGLRWSLQAGQDRFRPGAATGRHVRHPQHSHPACC